ncbi:MAG: zf-TFIIB domain-containing protein [Anaerolineae bacterium]|nr:zf-TFIIB domain-containing protein [Anaerolineae bacterium]MDW8300560.1 zf-TFIIB domain-containing protein [Anaerolineae bacterium]
MQCPVCLTVELRIAERLGVEIDYCPKCRGVWLDRGELDKIIERAESALPADYDLSYGEPPKAKRGAEAPDLLDLEGDFAERRRAEAMRRYDDDDYRPERFRYEEMRPHGKRKGFLSELFDIFD